MNPEDELPYYADQPGLAGVCADILFTALLCAPVALLIWLIHYLSQ